MSQWVLFTLTKDKTGSTHVLSVILIEPTCMKGNNMCMLNILGTCIVAAQLTHGGNLSKAPILTNGLDESHTYSSSKHYTPEETPVVIGGSLYTNNKTKISLEYANGLDTQALDINDSLKVQVIKQIDYSDRLSFNVSGGYTFGGEGTHTPCTDQYGDYNCDSLKNWESSDNYENKDDWNVGFAVRWTF